ncbi:hypothetical protein NAV33_07175 [Pseudomonas stutzeri]|uniref:hypothetical protein n=1 Tax=Stutzerimonas stutzeri TaxID=316 RepID=UPI00210EDD83|nr:hypothetical protein [Stutzerimonas stutzeri]MCQ4311675.1 hypothetical protein [Stutzerimonas stutzeri]
MYIDLGHSVPVEPENCLECLNRQADHRFGIPLATEEEMVTGWHRPLAEDPDYLDISDWAYGPALGPSEVFDWTNRKEPCK